MEVLPAQADAKRTVTGRGRRRTILAAVIVSLALLALPVSATADTAGGFGPDDASALPNELHVFEGMLVFVADDGVHGAEPWVSDGTAAGTAMLRDLAPGAEDSFPWPFAATAEALFFGAGIDGRALWVTDGTPDGTRRILPDRSMRARPLFDEFAATPGTLFFVADDPETGAELWTSDGTVAGTRLVKDLRPGTAGSEPTRLTAVGDSLFFTAMTAAFGGDTAGPEGGVELWTSDGTEEGTRSIGGLKPPGVEPRGLTDVGGTLHFLTRGRRIWTSDGTEVGTRVVARVTPHRGGMAVGAGDMEAVGDRLFFIVDAGRKDELWTSDGTDAGTQRLRRFKRAEGLVAVDGSLYFVADDGKHGREPWMSDGTKPGTRMVKDVRPGKKPSRPHDFATAAGQAVFTADDGQHGPEVWVTDGSPDGTRIVRDIRQGPRGARHHLSLWLEGTGPASLEGRVYFPADDGTSGTELWVSDGTPEGTSLVLDIHPPE